MLTGGGFIPLSMALAEAMVVILVASVALFIAPMGVLVAGGTVVGGYLLTHKVLRPITNRLGKRRLDVQSHEVVLRIV